MSKLREDEKIFCHNCNCEMNEVTYCRSVMKIGDNLKKRCSKLICEHCKYCEHCQKTICQYMSDIRKNRGDINKRKCFIYELKRITGIDYDVI